MAYQRERTEDDYDWVECYVCGEKRTDGCTDLAGSQLRYEACARCCKHGAPIRRPDNWTSEQSREVIAKWRAANPPLPPQPKRKLSESERKTIERFVQKLG